MARIIKDITIAEYHALPGLSASTAETIVLRSPAHARAERDREREASKTMDRGTILHELVLGKGAGFVAVNADDWRTKAAKEAREAIRAEGKTPVLAGDLEDYKRTAGEISLALINRGLPLDGESEVMVEWEEPSSLGPVQCRGMFDHAWVRIGTRGRILDLKITEDASEQAVERTAARFGYEIQAHAYRRALVALFPDLVGRVEFIFAFCEPEPPYAVRLCRPDGAFEEHGERRWKRAVEAWAKATKTGEWPAYDNGITTISTPMWAIQREEYIDA